MKRDKWGQENRKKRERERERERNENKIKGRESVIK